jgi:hypothetical protein
MGVGHTEIEITVCAFAEVDARHEFTAQIRSLLDIFSCMTNVSFLISNDMTRKWAPKSKNINTFLSNPDWLDGISREEGHLRLTDSQFKFCDDMISAKIEVGRLTRAAHLFHKALMIYYKEPVRYDEATALFVSALEAVDIPVSKTSTCPECGQEKYKISRRIVDLGVRHLGPHVEKLFRDYYDRRSKYLHAGRLISFQPMVDNIIPQLDPQGIEGCAMPSAVGIPMNLMEFSGFIIRREMQLFTECA